MFGLFFKKKSEEPELSVHEKSLHIPQYLLIIALCALSLFYCVLFIGLTLYVKHETKLINQASRISIAREADILIN